MSEPDELYTLRAQFWLGHYAMALNEAKQIQRRPMSPALKSEREELVQRCYLAMGQPDKVVAGDTSALQALNLQARYYMNPTDESLIAQLQSMLGDGVDPATQLYAAQIFLQAGMKKEALQAVFGGRSLQQLSLASQIYLQLDRLDLANKEYAKMLKIDEDSILTQMTSVYLQLAKGSSGASDALHLLQQLSEQYGASVLLLNLTACALLQAGQYAQAEAKLNEAMQDFAEEAQKSPDTLVNLIVSQQYQQKPTTALVEQLQASYPNHFLVQGLTMVQGAFEREAVKYQVA